MTSAPPQEARPARHWEGRPPARWAEAWGVPLLECYERIGSTNDRARVLAEAGAPDGTVVLAERQTAGRGRRGRRWHAPAGTALLFSMVLRPPTPSGVAGEWALGALPLRVGLAAARAVEAVAGVEVGIKWPNDLMLPGRGKVGGILCEGSLGGGNGFVVAGIGINVRQQPGDWPDEVRHRATSLALATGRAVDRTALAGAVIRAVHAVSPRAARPLDRAALDGIAARDILRQRLITLDGTVQGTACGIAPDGALRVRTGEGTVREVRSGTVRLITDPAERGGGGAR